MAEIRRRDNPTSGLHEFYVYDDGEEYPFHAVKQGRVEKQKRLAQSRREEEQAKQQPPPGEQG